MMLLVGDVTESLGMAGVKPASSCGVWEAAAT